MWRAIKAALAAFSQALRSTTAAFGSAVIDTGDWLIDRWNWWARLVSGTSYRPEPVTDLEDHVADMTACREPCAVPRDDRTELGRRVRLAAQAILEGATEAPGDLPGEVQLWLLARSTYDLTLTVRATDEAVGLHLAGVEELRGPHGSHVPGIDLRRDEKLLLVRLEASRPKVRDPREQERIRELFSVATPAVSTEPPSPAPLMPRVALSPSY